MITLGHSQSFYFFPIVMPPLLLFALFIKVVRTAPLRMPAPKRMADRASCSLWRWM